jgi:LysR family nitrogen assimilation transcriptional regulator
VPSVLPTHRYDLQIVRLAYRQKRLREAYAIALGQAAVAPPAANDFRQSLLAHVREVFPISRPSKAETRAPPKRRVPRGERDRAR